MAQSGDSAGGEGPFGGYALQGRRRPDCIVSELNTHPAYPLYTLRWVPHDSSARLEAEWIATPFS
jgi:hypothetical protein